MSSKHVYKRNKNQPSSQPACEGGDMRMETSVGGEGSQLDQRQSVDLNLCGDKTDDSQMISSRTELTFVDRGISEEFHKLQKLLGLPDEVMCMKRMFEIISSILTSPWPWNLWKNRHQATAKELSTPHLHVNSEVRGHVCVPVNISIEKWFTDAAEHSKLDPEDFLIYLLLVYSQINTSILTGETSAETAPNLLHLVKYQEKSCQQKKYQDLTLSTLATEISTVTELFDSNLNAESECEGQRKDKTITKGRRTKSGTRGSKSVKQSDRLENGGKWKKGKRTKGTSKPSGRGRRTKLGLRETPVENENVMKIRGRPLTRISPGLELDGGDVIPEAEGEHGVVQVKVLKPRHKGAKQNKTLLDAGTDASGDGQWHIVTKHRDPKGLRTQKDYILHKDEAAKTVARRNIYECRLCRKKCHGWASWSNHKSQHFTNRPDIVCPTCGWITKTKSGMWAHRKRHGNIREKCPHCEYTNYVKSAIKVHIMQAHPELSEKKPRVHICDTCKHQFKTSSSLRVHVKLHKRLVRDQVCSVCDKTFYSRKLLQDHVRAVHADKRFSCEKCDKKFAKRRSLDTHFNRVHLRIKAIQCHYEDCDQLFYEKKDLKQHIIVYHTKERNYPCEWATCQKSFRTLYQRKIHMRIHTDEKPLKCPHCDYSARQRSSLTCHLKKHAPESDGDVVKMSGAPGRKKRTTVLKGETRTVTFVASIPAQSGAVVNQVHDPLLLPAPQPGVELRAQPDWGGNWTAHVQKEALNSEELPEAVPGQPSSTSHGAQPLVLTIPVHGAQPLVLPLTPAPSGEHDSTAFPGTKLGEHSGSFRTTSVKMDVESSGKPTFMKRVIDIPESDEYKTVPVVEMAGQVPNSLPYQVMMPGMTAQRPASSMMTVQVFTAEELMNMTSLPMVATKPAAGVTMMTANLAEQPKSLMTEANIAMVTSQEQPKYLSMPIFTDAEGFSILNPEIGVTAKEQNASITSQASIGVAEIPAVTSNRKPSVSLESVSTELRRSPVFTTGAGSASQADHTMGVSTSVVPSHNTQGDAGCSSLVLGALQQLHSSFQTVQLHQVVQQAMPTTTTSSLDKANLMSDEAL
ncbi:uncharacterized protein LOC135497189 [Lineus longissimus]|uniref:uncharacterized protein LOC135497189 n=1 Tax=Lineus longissimus TaxID=88925 RepID=UPI00315E00CD